MEPLSDSGNLTVPTTPDNDPAGQHSGNARSLTHRPLGSTDTPDTAAGRSLPIGGRRDNEPLFTSPRLFPVAQEQLTSDDYYTPRWVFERMGITFDLDVCAPPGGVPWIPADRYLTMENDGLASPWVGRVFMNPPFSQATVWVRRFIAHADGVCLVPQAKAQWHVELWDQADAVAVPEARFTFTGGPTDGNIRFAVMFAAFGDECADAIGRIGMVRRKVG